MFVFKVFLISLFLLIVACFVVATIGEALEKAEKFGREYYILVNWYFNCYFVVYHKPLKSAF